MSVKQFEKKKTIVHLVTPYLFHTGSWVYSQLTGIRKYDNIVFTQRLQNLDLFPFDPVVSPNQFSSLQQIKNSAYFKLTERYSPLLLEKLKQAKPNLIHAHFGFEAYRWLSMIYSLKLPLITTFYGVDVSHYGKIPKWKKRYEKLFDYGTLFLAEGSYLKHQLEELGCSNQKIIVQHLGVNINSYPQKDFKAEQHSSKVIILQVSTFREKKGLEYSLNAYKKVLSTFPNTEFRIIGGGDNKVATDKIINLAKSLNVQSNVKFLGIKSHSETLFEMKNADIFLHPSVTASNGDNEGGAPVSVIEASAIGLPIISTYHADIPEVVIDGKTGYLSPERDTDSLSEKICLLVKDVDLRRQFGMNGIQHITTHYNLSLQIQKLEELYGSVIGNGKKE